MKYLLASTLLFFSFFCFSTEIPQTLISNNAAWQYKDDGLEPAIGWKSSYLNSTWKTAQSPLGYGQGQTVQMASSKITYYFRKAFTVTNYVSMHNFLIKLRRDDGAIVYINGTQVYKDSNLPATVTSTTLTTSTGDNGVATVSITVPNSAFKEGENIVAVEVHNSSITSSDIFLEMEASAILTGCAVPTTLFATIPTTNTAKLNWASSGATSYNIQYKKHTATAFTTATSQINSLNLMALTPNIMYDFKVQAVCATLKSAYSDITSFMTILTKASAVPAFDHIVVVIGENMMPSKVIGSADAPFINSLANAGANFSESYALSHPSQPNYLQLFSGSSQGIVDDNPITTKFTTPNLARELINAGKTFINYSEGQPSVGFDGSSQGNYRRKHNAVANWVGAGTNQVSSTLSQPFTSFPSNFGSLPNVSFVIPDLCNDGHDVCSPLNNKTKQYDTWIKNNLTAYKDWAKSNNSLLIVTFDEDDFTNVNRISTVFYGANVKVGVYNQRVDHYSILRMMEDAMKLTTHAGGASASKAIDFCWAASPATRIAISDITQPVIEESNDVQLYPNPSNGSISITLSVPAETAGIHIYSPDGIMLYNHESYLLDTKNEIKLNIGEYAQRQGLYFIVIEADKKVYTKTVMISK